LEIGCGSGHTLQYLWKEKQAGELWGLDVSQEQLRFTNDLLAGEHIQARLLLSSMDENPGIPESHFDLVISIYALGWSPDLHRTLALIYSYLKPGGKFIFSWEHPVYQCLEYDLYLEKYYLKNSYLDESPERKPSWRGVEIVLQPRMLSTYVNALCDTGFRIERLVESKPNPDLAREEDFAPEKWYSIPRAQMIPTTLIVKASKPM
jgi:SAM-dependent methyltransferase